MKCLSKLRSCCGVATIAPAAETTPATVTLRKQEEGVGNSSHAVLQVAPLGLRKAKSTRSKHWKPTLHAISEDSVIVPEIESRSRFESEDDKLSAKVKDLKAKSTCCGKDYW